MGNAENTAGEKAAGATVNVDVGDDAAICQNLFRGLVFFLGRECPMKPLLFTIRYIPFFQYTNLVYL